MMSVAAVIGLVFDLSVLARVAEIPVDQLLDGLREGEIGGLIGLNKKPGRFVFQHALVREGLYESLSGAERARLHRRIGEAFEELSRDNDSFLADIAFHFYESALFGGDHKAAEYCVRAAEHAFGERDQAQSERMCQMALAALELPTSMSDEQRRQMRERINQVQRGYPPSVDGTEMKTGGNAGPGIAAFEDAAPDSVGSEPDLPPSYLSLAGNSELLTEHGLLEEHKVFRKEGEYWTIVFEQKTIRLRNSLGVRCIARLLENPERQLLALDLLAFVRGGFDLEGSAGNQDVNGLIQLRPSDLGPHLDQTAKSAYRERLMDLRHELEDAKQFNDMGRVSMIEEEISAIARELASAVGLGKRDRRMGSDVERARVSATNAIRGVLRKMSPQHPSLARYLTTTIRTGSFCGYFPDPRFPGAWRT
jgi:hypothetical protein